ncbi:hypothetical protein PGT21_035881 [Puccinia graminis f. sp. tritici]|uniref:Uncharacterized protein n=1 Tax=Puccinia graminis f. sp. tritici TaxID=56615 RepID=A0A5B0PNC8_PUCGR|nr:hypothetical protein PGT21_035881 [Puccinia graminis f. sp. tritici]
MSRYHHMKPGRISTEVSSALPAHSNPFVYMKDELSQSLTLPLSRPFVVVLLVFFVFHVLVAGLCLLILILPSISRSKSSTQWLWMKLFIKDQSGELIYRTPLYFTNGGIILTISQLCNSVTSQAFIWCQIKVSGPFDEYRLTQILALLGVMYVFGYMGYCSLAHCFFVTGYYGRKTYGCSSKRMFRWISPPTLINTASICYPLLTIATIMAVTIRLFLAHRTFSNELTKLLRNVNQGSAIWEKLQHNSLSLEEKLVTTNRLSRQDLRIKELGLVVQEHLDAVLRCFQIFSCTVASFLCVCCQLFMFSFWKLIRSNLREASKPKITLTIATNTLNYESPADESSPQTDLISVNQVQSGAMLSNRQLTYLSIRAFAIFISMSIVTVLLLLLAFKPSNFLLDPYWRGVMAWLSSAGNTFSAICIAFHSWKLFVAQSNATGTDSQSILLSSNGLNSPTRQSEGSPLWHPGVKIQLCRKDITAIRQQEYELE